MKEFNLMKSEIKKAERFAAKESGVTCFLAAWGYDGVDDLGWADVLCEMHGTWWIKERERKKERSKKK